MKGKTLIPFITHGGYGVGNSLAVVARHAPAARIRDGAFVLQADRERQTMEKVNEWLDRADTVVWNGPLGVFEFDQFGEGTKALSLAIAESDGFSIAGGGDTLAAIGKYDIEDKVSYISTGGGAFLEYVEGKKLPAVAALEQAAKL